MDAMDKYLGKTLDNRYEMLEIIGSGGMAVVYKALCHRLNRHVAIKILREELAADPEFRRRFQTESQAVAMLSHPNIVAVYDVSRSGEAEYIVMELIEGVTLKQYMTKKGALSWREALHFTSQIAKALSHAHGRGIIHRDIKPHNIMIDKDGTVKVADFGIARLQNTQNTVTQLTLGSVHYISPEQARGEPVTAATDIYSLGVVMYEMLTGQLPFDGDSAVAVAVAHINSVPTPPRAIIPGIPPGLESVTMKAMNPELSERYQSADELLYDVDEFTKTQTSIEAGGIMDQPRILDVNVHSGEEQYLVRRNVKPVSRSGELSKKDAARNWNRSRKVSMLSGFGIVGVLAVLLIVFLYNFIFKDLFAEPQRIIVPSFVGSYQKDVENDAYLQSVFQFTFTTESSDEDEGLIIGQSESKGKSLMLRSEKIPIGLRVSAGTQSAKVPNVINLEYRQAEETLKKLGFKVALASASSDSITKDYVTETDPAGGTELSWGSEIKLIVSSGPVQKTLQMPSLYGMTLAQARQKLESLKLSYVNKTDTPSDKYAEGLVCWQNVEPGTEIAEHSKIYVYISTGPDETPAPPSAPGDGAQNPPR